MSAENNGFSPNTSDFIVQIALLLIGLSLAFGADRLIKLLDNQQASIWAGIFQFATLFVILVVWLHAEIAYGAIETYSDRSSIVLTVIEYWMEILNLVFPVFAALNIGNLDDFIFFLILVYISDFVLAAFTVMRQRFESRRHEIEYDTNKRWLWVNGGTAVVVGLLYWSFYANANAGLLSGLVFTAVLVSSFADYFFNSKFYFGYLIRPSSSRQPRKLK